MVELIQIVTALTIINDIFNNSWPQGSVRGNALVLLTHFIVLLNGYGYA